MEHKDSRCRRCHIMSVRVRNFQVTMSVTSSSEDSTQDQGQSSTSLLSILDDKNQVIAVLREQVHNQKIQIQYYLKNKLSREVLQKYSSTCISEVGEENLAISLELVHFCKRNGIPSKLNMLYTNVSNTAHRMRNILRLQERAFYKIKPNFKAIKNNNELQIIANLHQLNVQLHKELRNFKMCCNKLISIEDERNAIAEEFCTLPASEKYSKKSLMLLTDEKIALERELEELKEEKSQIMQRNENFSEETPETLNAMLEIVNEEAGKILESSLLQKEAFQKDIKRLNLENDSLKLKLRKLMEILRSKEDLVVKVKHMEDVCLQSIKEHVFTQKKQKQRWMKELRVLKKKVELLTAERDALKKKLNSCSWKKENSLIEKEVYNRSKELLDRERLNYKVQQEHFKKEVEALKRGQEELRKRQESLEKEKENFVRSYELFQEEKEKFKNHIEEVFEAGRKCGKNVVAKIDTSPNVNNDDGDYTLKNKYNVLLAKVEKQGEISEFLQSQIKTLLLVIYLLGRNVPRVASKEIGDHLPTIQSNEGKMETPTLFDDLINTEEWLQNVGLQSEARYSQSNADKPPSETDKDTALKRPKKYKAAKSSPALEQIQEMISQYGDFVINTRGVKSEPKTFDGTSNESTSEDSKLDSKEASFVAETKHFNSETSSTLESQCFKSSTKESDLMRDCSNESLQRFFQNTNKKVVETQLNSNSLPEMISHTNTQTYVNVEDKCTFSNVASLNKSVSSKVCKRDISTEMCSQFLDEIPNNKNPNLSRETVCDETENKCEAKDVDSDNNTAGASSAKLPMTPLEVFMEQSSIPANILQMNESDLVEKLKTISERLDENLTEFSSSSEISLISNIRCVFDTLFSCRSVYANE